MSYIVIENTPGYLPEVEPPEFDTFAEACEYADSLALDLIEEGYRVVWNDWVRGNDARSVYLERAPDDRGRVIDIRPYN